jgi:hypothetical protein
MKNEALTIRVPASLKRRLKARAASHRRSLSAQVLVDLERAPDESSRVEARGRFLGLFVGMSVPTDRDIAEVRRRLWGALGRSG